jgi:hypothetical protein
VRRMPRLRPAYDFPKSGLAAASKCAERFETISMIEALTA